MYQLIGEEGQAKCLTYATGLGTSPGSTSTPYLLLVPRAGEQAQHESLSVSWNLGVPCPIQSDTLSLLALIMSSSRD